MSLDFPAFALSPEHDALRESVRALAEEKIAPHAAKVDQAAEFPAGGPRRPGQGRPARRAHPGRVRRRGRRRDRHRDRDRGGGPGLRVVLADPGGQQAGHDAADAGGLGGGQAALPAAGRPRGGHVLVRAVRARGRLRRGRDEDPGRPRRGQLRPERGQALDHQRRHLPLLHGHGGDRPGGRRARGSRRSWWSPATRGSPTVRPSTSWGSRARRPGSCTSTTA